MTNTESQKNKTEKVSDCCGAEVIYKIGDKNAIPHCQWCLEPCTPIQSFGEGWHDDKDVRESACPCGIDGEHTMEAHHKANLARNGRCQFCSCELQSHELTGKRLCKVHVGRCVEYETPLEPARENAWDSKEGQTHFENDGCGEPEHNEPSKLIEPSKPEPTLQKSTYQDEMEFAANAIDTKPPEPSVSWEDGVRTILQNEIASEVWYESRVNDERLQVLLRRVEISMILFIKQVERKAEERGRKQGDNWIMPHEGFDKEGNKEEN